MLRRVWAQVTTKGCGKQQCYVGLELILLLVQGFAEVRMESVVVIVVDIE